MFKKVEITQKEPDYWTMKIWYNSLHDNYDYFTSALTQEEIFKRLSTIIDEDEEDELNCKILRAEYERDKQREEST